MIHIHNKNLTHLRGDLAGYRTSSPRHHVDILSMWTWRLHLVLVDVDSFRTVRRHDYTSNLFYYQFRLC